MVSRHVSLAVQQKSGDLSLVFQPLLVLEPRLLEKH